MNAVQSFFAMGGYGGFIWPSYALAAIVMVGLYVWTARFLRKNETALKAFESTEEEDVR